MAHDLVEVIPGHFIRVDHRYNKAMGITKAQAMIEWHRSLGHKIRTCTKRVPLQVCRLLSLHCLATQATVTEALKATGYDKIYTDAKVRKSVFDWRAEGKELKFLGRGSWRQSSKDKICASRRGKQETTQPPQAPSDSACSHPLPTADHAPKA